MLGPYCPGEDSSFENVKDWISIHFKGNESITEFLEMEWTLAIIIEVLILQWKHMMCLKRMQRQTTDLGKIFAKTQVTKDCYLKHTPTKNSSNSTIF